MSNLVFLIKVLMGSWMLGIAIASLIACLFFVIKLIKEDVESLKMQWKMGIGIFGFVSLLTAILGTITLIVINS